MKGDATLGLYIHVPFCRTRCRYCDFYRVGARDDRMTAFLGALQREVEAVAASRPWPEVETVFLGGGTPSLVSPRRMGALLDLLARRFSFAAGVEVSFEANPSDLSPERLAGYRAAGLNRISLGVQSFQDRELALLGRRHDARRAADSVAWARRAGFDVLSLDLMLGIPGQTRGSLRSTLSRALSLAPEHVSAYILEVHAGSEIDGLRRVRPGLFPGADGERRSYRAVVDALTGAGYEHYEVSNFCRPGYRSAHNSRYWRRQDYLGFGPSAHSCVGEARWRNPPDLHAYLEDPTRREEQPSEAGPEVVYLGLRLAEGLAVEVVAGALDVEPEAVRRRARELTPFVVTEGDRIRLSTEGFLLSTSVLAELLDLGRKTA